MYIRSEDRDVSLANLICDCKISNLGAAQSKYLMDRIAQLPMWAQTALIDCAESKLPSDAYDGLYNARLSEAINFAKEVIDPIIINASNAPISQLLSKINGGTELSFDAILSRICKEEQQKLKPRDPEAEKDFDALVERCSGPAKLALVDCKKLLSERTLAGEMAEFYRKAITHFRPDAHDEYVETLQSIHGLWQKRNKDIIGEYIEGLRNIDCSEDIMISRKRYLFGRLPINASIANIAWALNISEAEVPEKVPIVEQYTKEKLLYLGCMKMEDLYDAERTADERWLLSLVESIRTTCANFS
jgi:hypothetical protein